MSKHPVKDFFLSFTQICSSNSQISSRTTYKPTNTLPMEATATSTIEMFISDSLVRIDDCRTADDIQAGQDEQYYVDTNATILSHTKLLKTTV